MDMRSHKSVSIDLFNLPPLPNERNNEESYMDSAIQLLHPQWEEFQAAGQNRQGGI